MSPRARDGVAAVIAAFVDYLEGRGSRPTVDHLPAEQRREAEHLMKLMEAGRGIDPARIPPVDPERVDRVLPGSDSSRGLGLGGRVGRIRAELESISSHGLAVDPDTAAGALGARSDLLVRAGGLRIRVMLLEGISDEAQLGTEEVLSEADRIFYRFPDTAAVAIVASELNDQCVVVEPHDTRPGIGSPHGEIEGPKVRRALPVRSAITGYLDGVEPIWEEPPGFSIPDGEGFSPVTVATTAAASVIDDLVQQGRRAVTQAKKVTWSALGQREVERLVALAVAVSSGHVDADDLDDRLEAIVGDAA